MEKILDDLNILVVDDESVNCKICKLNLESLGAKIIIAEDGNKAITLIKEVPFDLIITDIMMHPISGDEVCRQAREHGVSVPILSWSASVAIHEHIRPGFTDCLPKPFNKICLIQKIIKNIGIEKLFAGKYKDCYVNKSDYGDLFDNLEFVARLNDIKTSLTKYMENVESSIITQNREQISFNLHKLKGALGIIGYIDASSIVAAVEKIDLLITRSTSLPLYVFLNFVVENISKEK